MQFEITSTHGCQGADCWYLQIEAGGFPLSHLNLGRASSRIARGPNCSFQSKRGDLETSPILTWNRMFQYFALPEILETCFGFDLLGIQFRVFCRRPDFISKSCEKVCSERSNHHPDLIKKCIFVVFKQYCSENWSFLKLFFHPSLNPLVF